MEYQIHGIPVYLDEKAECGIYKPRDGGLINDYSEMNPADMIKILNSVPKERAIEEIAGLKDLADKQLKNGGASDFGSPFLKRKNNFQVPFSDVEGNIENTRKFAEDILRALSGK